MNRPLQIHRLGLLAVLLALILSASACATDDPYLKAKVDKENADTQIKLEQWNIDKQYVPLQKEAELQRGWIAFGVITGLLGLAGLVGLLVAVDHYRLHRRQVLVELADRQGQQELKKLRAVLPGLRCEAEKLHAEVEQDRARLEQMHSQVREARLELDKLRAEIKTNARLLGQIRAQVPPASPGNGRHGGSELGGLTFHVVPNPGPHD